MSSIEIPDVHQNIIANPYEKKNCVVKKVPPVPKRDARLMIKELPGLLPGAEKGWSGYYFMFHRSFCIYIGGGYTCFISSCLRKTFVLKNGLLLSAPAFTPPICDQYLKELV